MLASLFFVSAHKDSATRHGCALRSACRGASACRWHASYGAGLGSRLGRCWALPTGEQHPSRQARQVLLPLPKSRRKHWVFAGFLFACVAWLCGSPWFKLWLFPSGFTRSQPFSSPLAPKTHPVSPFSGFSGCVFLFFAVFRPQNFCPGFCAFCRIVVTS